MAISVTDEVRRLYRMTWWALMLRGLLGLAIGVFVLLRPLDSIAAFALVIALWAVFLGLVDIVQAVHLRSALAHWWVVLLGGLVGVAFGVLALIYYPGLALAFAIVWASLWLMATGLLQLYAGYRLRRLGLEWGWWVVFGALGVIAGVAALFVPRVTIAAIMGVIAAFAIVGGTVSVVGAFKLRSLVRP
jgi:uncharacterized membrane protein HdeD (DUF308 family)